MTLAREIEHVLNKHCAENESNTPDFILAEYLMECLAAFDRASRKRERWYGYQLVPARADGSCVKLDEPAAHPQPGTPK